jgi:hypothetical protein
MFSVPHLHLIDSLELGLFNGSGFRGHSFIPDPVGQGGHAPDIPTDSMAIAWPSGEILLVTPQVLEQEY